MASVKTLLPTQTDSSGENPGTTDPSYLVSNNNRWSRVALNFESVEHDAWCELSFYLEWNSQEENLSAHDFAAIGVDFLTEDGSSIDFAYVPGLTKTQIDPHSWYVNGPDYHDHGRWGSRVSLGFFIPSPTKKIAVNIRSWRNSHPFIVRNPRLLQRLAAEDEASDESADPARVSNALRPLNARRTWRSFNAEPIWINFSVIPERRLLIRGQIINENLGPDGAMARIVYRNAKGAELPPPYPETSAAPSVGSFIGIPVHRQARRFTLDLIPPPEAASVDVGFQTWHAQTGMELAGPLEVSLEDDLTLEAISDENSPDAVTFLRHLMARLDPSQSPNEPASFSTQVRKMIDPKALASPQTVQAKLKAMQRGGTTEFSGGMLTLGSFPEWSLLEQPAWMEDPFLSPAWRLEFQSLSWIESLLEEDKADNLNQAIALAVSWSLANAWGSQKDPISAHPRALSARAEMFLCLLCRSALSQKTVKSREFLTLFSETVRHAFALAEILGQNIFAHSVVHLHAACALLALARCLPRISLAPYWESLALFHLKDGFDRFLDENGTFIEQSPHVQLEVISLGLVLARQLEGRAKTAELHRNLTERIRISLRPLVAVTDPSGYLPPFGDSPHGIHHAAWLRRLLSDYGAGLLSDPELASELSYPPGKKVFSSEKAGLIAVRRYDRNAHWSYFCSSLSGRHHEHGHFDCASFLYSTGGAPWVIDPRGSKLHDAGVGRQYLVSSRAHNIALPDGRDQLAGIGWIESQEELEGATLFVLGSNAYGPEYAHRRIFVTLEGLDAIAVLDHFVSQPRPIAFEGFLHFDTNIIVAIAATQMGVAYRKNEKLKVTPYAVKGQFNGMSIENGRNDRPSLLQGFVARAAGGLQPANVLSYRFSGHEAVCGGVMLSVNDKAARSLSRLLDKLNVLHTVSRLTT
ncbi:heparinase II/III-family protein [Microvirga sp. ACRRW]|uniref:heparinase II/III domain-containing protein n=1 Tax=Microvirga sp. ACRRW TaxID=2918205 RepID=UPI001EF5DE5B|nr:heparinase II/III family protein [Microvirga sp. ACRRW]MCG7392058.1 heparinase II/III-family protein [Microvirga sp. ACRRW]